MEYNRVRHHFLAEHNECGIVMLKFESHYYQIIVADSRLNCLNVTIPVFLAFSSPASRLISKV